MIEKGNCWKRLPHEDVQNHYPLSSNFKNHQQVIQLSVNKYTKNNNTWQVKVSTCR